MKENTPEKSLLDTEIKEAVKAAVEQVIRQKNCKILNPEALEILVNAILRYVEDLLKISVDGVLTDILHTVNSDPIEINTQLPKFLKITHPEVRDIMVHSFLEEGGELQWKQKEDLVQFLDQFEQQNRELKEEMETYGEKPEACCGEESEYIHPSKIWADPIGQVPVLRLEEKERIFYFFPFFEAKEQDQIMVSTIALTKETDTGFFTENNSTATELSNSNPAIPDFDTFEKAHFSHHLQRKRTLH